MSRSFDFVAADRKVTGLHENVRSPGVEEVSTRKFAPSRHIVHVFPSFGVGGVPIRISDVISKLGPAYRHSIIALDGCYDSRYRLTANVQAELIDVQIGSGNFIKGVGQAHRFLRQLRPDLLATYNWGAIEWALANMLFKRGPHVHFESGFGPEEADRQIRRRVFMRRIALAGNSKLVVPSRTLECIALDIWRIARKKIHYVPNGVDIERFSALPVAGAIKGFAKRSDELIVGTVAPLRREKNIERLIRAFSAIETTAQPVRLLIVGEGNERPQLEALVRDIGIAERVFFAGHVDKIEQILGWIDVFAISSDTEQMPNALLQAMASGRAVAAVDVGDVGIIVNEANYPYVVPRDDPTALKEAMTCLLNDEELRRRIGRANFEHVRNTYSLNQMLKVYRTIFDNGLVPSVA